MKSVEDILGTEYDWLATDVADHVGFFSTAGGGNVPVEFLENVDAYGAAIETLLSTPASAEDPGRSDIWRAVALRGLFAFDSDFFGAPYKRQVVPVLPLSLDQLPTEVAAVARRVRFGDVRFADIEKLPQRLLPVVRRR